LAVTAKVQFFSEGFTSLAQLFPTMLDHNHHPSADREIASHVGASIAESASDVFFPSILAEWLNFSS
jgi:hypothetical protein